MNRFALAAAAVLAAAALSSSPAFAQKTYDYPKPKPVTPGFKPVTPGQPTWKPVQVPIQTGTPIPAADPKFLGMGLLRAGMVCVFPLAMFLVSAFMFGHSILAWFARMFYRVSAPSDARAAAFEDPWVKAEIERRRAGGEPPPTA